MRRNFVTLCVWLLSFSFSPLLMAAEEAVAKSAESSLSSLSSSCFLLKNNTQKAFEDFFQRTIKTITFTQGKQAALFDFRNHFEDVAFNVVNKAFWTLVGYNPDPSSIHIFGDRKEPEKVRITLINGMLNAKHNAEDNAKLVAKLHGNTRVHALYSASGGFTADLLRAVFAKTGFATPSARLLADTWRTLIRDMGGETGGGKIIHYAHSLGGAETDRALGLLSPDERKMISVHTFGSATLIDQPQATNYVSTHDVVPVFDTVRYVQGCLNKRDNVQFLESKNRIPLVDHLLVSETYKTRLAELGKKFQEEYLKAECIAKGIKAKGNKNGKKVVLAKAAQHKKDQQELIHKIKSLIHEKNYSQLGKTLAQDMDGTLTRAQLKEIAIKEDCKALKKALKAAKHILEKDTLLGLKDGELVQLTLFIETDFDSFKAKKKYYLREHETGLPRIVEYDPKTKQAFIHLGARGIPMLGAGFHKKVTKSILYDRKEPKVVANCRTTHADEKEMHFIETLQGTPGIVEGLAFIKHTQAIEQEDRLEIILKLYNSRTLRHIYYNGTVKFAPLEKMQIALELLQGLEKMHKKGIIHRDLHTGNYLVDVQQKDGTGQRDVRVAITDFGGAMHKKDCIGHQPQAFRWYLAPEGFFFQEMQGEDYFYTDVYALGCVFYELFYGKDPAWFDDKYYVNIYADEMTKRVEQQTLVQVINSATVERREALRIKQLTAPLGIDERFEALILRMVQPDAKARGTAHELRKEMKAILLDAKK